MTGTSAAAWLMNERLAYSQRLLESASGSIDSIAHHAGFGSVATLRTHFRETFGVTPSVWRERFAPAARRVASITARALDGGRV